jgi:pilus assembly protein FimV
MVRMLLKSLLSLSLIAPLSVFALGLGDIRLHSALSEPLEADIDLLSVSPAEVEGITVSLASQETFAKVGVDRPAILMYLKFEVVKDAANNYSIKVTSREQINEPFIDFLVEVDWKSGRVLREYTLLLDPPSSYREAAPEISTPSTAASSVPTAVAETKMATPPARQARTDTTVSPAAMAPTAGAMQATAMPKGALVYGPVKTNDTLWRIAQEMRPSKDISVQQMMVALVKANPYAFFDNNINRLKSGYVLRIDDPSMLGALSKADAGREVARQTRVWQDYRESASARASQRPAAASAVETAPGVAAASKREPKLVLVAPEGKGADSSTPSGSAEGKSVDAVSEELMLALESSAAQRKENETLKARLEALDGQLQDMEQIISLKDADFAALQQQLRKQGMPPEQQAAAKSENIVEEVAKPEMMPVVADAGDAEVKPAEVTAPETKKPVAKKPRPKVAPMPVEEPTLVESILDDPMMMGIGGGALLLILILLALIIKRRRKGDFQESILNGGISSMMKASDDQGSETSFLSDLAISGMGSGTIQTDEGEVDPLTEADVFMAYGRNQQAEEVLKKARENSPGRADIAAKLLEVYYNSKDSVKFEALAEEAVGSLQGNDELWGRVLAMGNELCPDNILFEAGATTELPAAAVTSHAESHVDTVMDIGLDLDELTAEMEGEGRGDMDIDLGLDFSDLDEGSDSDSAELDTSGLDDLDMGDFGLDEPEMAAEESVDLDFDLGKSDTEASTMEGASDSLDFDLDLDMGGDEEPDAETDMDFDLDLGELSVVADETATASDDDLILDLDMDELVTASDEGALDLGDFDLADLEKALDVGAETGTTSDEPLDLDMSLDDLGSLGDMDDFGDFGDLSDLGDLDVGDDEMTTKLDLAQAYAEMGDPEGARGMLEEVIAAGSDEQKQQAQALIDKL